MKVFLLALLTILSQFSLAENSEELLLNKTYKLHSYTNKLQPIEGEKCNYSSESNKDCTAFDGSVFKVVGIEKSKQSKNGKEVNDPVIKVTFEKVITKEVHDSDEDSTVEREDVTTVGESIAVKGHIYSYAQSKLKIRSVKLREAFEGYSLKAVLVPQKYYSQSKNYSSNPTVGVAVNVLPITGLEQKFELSVSLGVGFNQVTIDSDNGSSERTGFSYFIGYDFLDGENLSAGIYFGMDNVYLNSGETFNGKTNKSQGWWGLTLTSGF